MIKMYFLPHLESFMWEWKFEKIFFKKSPINPLMGCSLFSNYHFQMGVTVMGFAEHFGLCVLWLSRQRIWFLLLMSTYFSMPSTWLLKLDYGSRSEHQLHRQLKWARRNPFIVCSFPYCFWWTISKAFWFGLNFSACSRYQGCYVHTTKGV